MILRATSIDDALKSAADQAQQTREGAQKAAENVMSAPGKLTERAAKAAEDVMSAPQKIQESIEKDDGKVLDPSSPAGTVGAAAVSLAVIPYIPLSLYSSYVLVTTGSGLPAGPNGVYGAAEGFATLTVFLVSLWSLVSFATRARGLPEGPLSLLGVAQFGSYLAVLVFAGATYLTTGDMAKSNPFKGATPEVIATKVSKGIEGQVSTATAPLKATVDEKVKEAQKSQNDFLSSVQSKLDTAVGDAKKAASDKLETAQKAASDKLETAQKAASEKLEKVVPGAAKEEKKAEEQKPTKPAAAEAKPEKAQEKKAEEKAAAVAEAKPEKPQEKKAEEQKPPSTKKAGFEDLFD